jgi:hypothetical protein
VRSARAARSGRCTTRRAGSGRRTCWPCAPRPGQARQQECQQSVSRVSAERQQSVSRASAECC